MFPVLDKKTDCKYTKHTNSGNPQHFGVKFAIVLSLVLFFMGNEKLSRECVETLRSFVGIDAEVAVLKPFTY